MFTRKVFWFLAFLAFIFSSIFGWQFSGNYFLPQDEFIQVYFNHNQANKYIDPYRNISRNGDNLEEIIIQAIEGANSNIDLAVQELRLPKIARALTEKQKLGIKIRVILENTYSRAFSSFSDGEIEQFSLREKQRYQDFFLFADRDKNHRLSDVERKQSDALVMLQNASIPIIDDRADGSKGSGLMHHKFLVIDGKKTIVSSSNFTWSDIHGDFNNLKTRGNSNNLLVINSPTIAKIFTEEFNLMWGDGPGGNLNSKFGINKPWRETEIIKLDKSKIQLRFSPTSSEQFWNDTSNGLIGKILTSAENSINLALFVFSEQNLANVLEQVNEKKVKIQALIDPEFIFQSYSEAWDMLGLIPTNTCREEKDNHPWQKPIKTVGTPQLILGDKLHHKFAVIDKKIVITGSHNWSVAANEKNDETVLVIVNPQIARHFSREFERLYTKANLGIPNKLKKKNNCSNLDKNKPFISKIININTASKAELQTLPGIGSKLAEKIIAIRKEKPFTSLEDLTRVPGIKAKKLEKLQGKVTW